MTFLTKKSAGRLAVVAALGFIFPIIPSLASQSNLIAHRLPGGQQVWIQKPAGLTITKGQSVHALALSSPNGLQPKYLRQIVRYPSHERAGTVVIDTGTRHLYLIMSDGFAMRYGIGVARSGFEWGGTHKLSRKAKWPGWTPPAEMRLRQPELPRHMEGGPNNPLGARALYIGSTLYRIHGTNRPWTIGGNVSSGCIRLTNADVSDLYRRVSVGAKVIVH